MTGCCDVDHRCDEFSNGAERISTRLPRRAIEIKVFVGELAPDLSRSKTLTTDSNADDAIADDRLNLCSTQSTVARVTNKILICQAKKSIVLKIYRPRHGPRIEVAGMQSSNRILFSVLLDVDEIPERVFSSGSRCILLLPCSRAVRPGFSPKRDNPNPLKDLSTPPVNPKRAKRKEGPERTFEKVVPVKSHPETS